MPGRRERAVELARTAGAEAVVAAHPGTVTWLTGYPVDVETGPSPFAVSPIAVLHPSATPILVVSEDEAGAAAATGCSVAAYAGYSLDAEDRVAEAQRVLHDVVGGVLVATEAGALPMALAEGLRWVELGSALAGERAVKDPDEVELLRAAVAVCDVGQRVARELAEPGISELDLWAGVRAAVERAAAGRIPVLADLVSGPRTGYVGGPPGDRRLASDDLVLVDIVPRVAGYWGDSCATLAVGQPSIATRGMHDRCLRALGRVIANIRPGVVAAELDALAREDLEFPHHTGHGIGTAWHEEPRLTPGSRTVLEPGMVIAIEPGTYSATGVRVEQVVLVTADGHEVLSGHDLAL